MALLKLTALALLLTAAQCINIETKLDFQGEKQEKPKVLEKVFVVEKNEEKKNDGDVKLVCADGGCNATSTKLEGSGSIATDVVIEVKTILGGDKKGTKNTEEDDGEVPDVPIVLGYGGLGNSINPEDNAFNPPPLFDTNVHTSFSDVRNGNGFVPSYGVPHFNSELSPPRPLLVTDDDYKTVRYNVDQPSGHYLPPPTTHYLPKPSVNYNPLGPSRYPKPDWKTPSPWNSRHHGYSYQRPYHKPTTHYPWTKCNCHNHNAGWRPTTSRPFIPRPGVQINDKLAPLN